MGWTAPSTFTVGQLVTAATMNTNIRDNLTYLKGSGTDIQIGSAGQKWGLGVAPTRQLHLYGTGQTTAALADAGNTGGTVYVQDLGAAAGNGGAVLFGAQQGYFAAIKALLTGGGTNSAGDIAVATRNAETDSALTERLRIVSGGNVGIGTSAPQGKLHAVGAGGGCVFLSANAVGATLQTLTGNFITRGAGIFVGDVATSGANTAYGKIMSPEINTTQAYTHANGDVITLGITSGGALTIQRTSGVATHQVNMMVFYS